MLLQKQRNLGAGGLPFIGLALTFARLRLADEPEPDLVLDGLRRLLLRAAASSRRSRCWRSSPASGRAANVFGGNMNDEHTHNIGKLMLAFVCFWTYIAFSQLMLIWIAGLPDETPFYITRFSRRLGAGRRAAHLRPLLHPLRRAAVALAQAQPDAGWPGWRVGSSSSTCVDIFWLVMPSRDPEGFALPLDRPHRLPGRRPGGDRLRRLAPARQAPASRSRTPTSPNRFGTGSHEQPQPRHTQNHPPGHESEDQIDFTKVIAVGVVSLIVFALGTLLGDRDPPPRDGKRARPPPGWPRIRRSSARPRSASSIRFCSSGDHRLARPGARAGRASQRLRLDRSQQGDRPRPDRARLGSRRRPGRCPRERPK